jgi:hypothetical protein
MQLHKKTPFKIKSVNAIDLTNGTKLQARDIKKLPSVAKEDKGWTID